MDCNIDELLQMYHAKFNGFFEGFILIGCNVAIFEGRSVFIRGSLILSRTSRFDLYVFIYAYYNFGNMMVL
mgnify:CR=1 FL=1